MQAGPATPGEANDQMGSMFGRHMPLTTVVAITIALLATFMGVCGVKSGNISQAMQSNMANRIELMLENQLRLTRGEAADAAAEIQIRRDKAQYDRWQSQQAGFDLSEAALSLAIALLAITAIIQRWWLYIVSMTPAVFGVAMGLAGFFNWSIGMQHLSRFLEA